LDGLLHNTSRMQSVPLCRWIRSLDAKTQSTPIDPIDAIEIVVLGAFALSHDIDYLELIAFLGSPGQVSAP